MAPRDIVQATIKNCIAYQLEAAFFAENAAWYMSRPENYLSAAQHAQEQARLHYDEAWLRLARLIGVA